MKKTSETEKLSPIPSPKHPKLRKAALGDPVCCWGPTQPQAALVGVLILPEHWLGYPQGKGQMDRRSGTSLLPGYLGLAWCQPLRTLTCLAPGLTCQSLFQWAAGVQGPRPLSLNSVDTRLCRSPAYFLWRTLGCSPGHRLPRKPPAWSCRRPLSYARSRSLWNLLMLLLRQIFFVK